MKTVFFGTHNFAATILEGIINNPLFDIQLVITQPDKPVGRKQELQKSPVKLLAEKHGLPITQPVSLKSYALHPAPEDIGHMTYDVGICAQYGLIIPEDILNAPKHGIINVHTSLLPKYRGASPIQSALINGEEETGVTLMKMDAGLDTGPILWQKALKIEPNDNYTTVEEKLAKIAILGLTEAIPDYVAGTLSTTPQDNAHASICKELTREDGRIDWSKTAQQIYNQYRGLTPWPGVWTVWNDKRLKLLQINPSNKTLQTGQVLVEGDKIYIGAGDQAIEILELQLEGKQKTSAKDFINGYKSIDKVALS
ncbi:MAG: methionyl-tRNA formyltransferase [Candidatus Magasanikbacteria bacterium RIFCSPLOWO2_01_FULL_43_20b]|uniref:Methionyl-tRNA formyltransferase n=1 Tax=Candidatus Magasanikbacteria bacterium RIFCSPLOWO2_12_FULL_43_12 TaxID=1798692 RepID=A0A1F6MSA4_9BACT|nr:MAG: methionyl-tRNA formyltransferase [Candidatus Magasanikbacteria bacterium RIFCSPLOWO2_02_FULL_43_22]OGH73610.1 MAG: methionyl-tRNA formyltransferase [Candidatus Magasanikbacteria bacterium RIFCSPLOWO2_01_FULL_43_20b]OGH74507.1 MAG: methionyl-tRNA formyltransferase [Candidatus Magasanikbacteria bacterium RIFCSPLOWO2_12_FULL_43_12]